MSDFCVTATGRPYVIKRDLARALGVTGATLTRRIRRGEVEAPPTFNRFGVHAWSLRAAAAIVRRAQRPAPATWIREMLTNPKA